MSYRIAPRGVINIVTGDLVLPHMAEWTEYVAWLHAGNSPEPRDPTPEEIEKAARAQMITDLRAESTITHLRTHTPSEAAAYVNANVTDLASAKNVLAKLAMICAYLARERLAGE
jgi:hypothetical protein